MPSVAFSYRYAQCRCADCRYPQCRGVILTPPAFSRIGEILKVNFNWLRRWMVGLMTAQTIISIEIWSRDPQIIKFWNENLNHRCLQILQKSIDIERKTRLLKVCNVPATSATFLAFFLFFLLWPLTVLMRQTRQAVCDINQSIFIRCLCSSLTLNPPLI